MKIIEKLIKIKRALGISQKNLAQKIGVSRQTLSRWMNGAVKKPSGEHMFIINKLYEECVLEGGQIAKHK